MSFESCGFYLRVFPRKYKHVMFLLLENVELQTHFDFIYVPCSYFQCYSHLDTWLIFFALELLIFSLFWFLVFFMLSIFSFITYTYFSFSSIPRVKEGIPCYPYEGYCTSFSTLLLYWI